MSSTHFFRIHLCWSYLENTKATSQSKFNFSPGTISNSKFPFEMATIYDASERQLSERGTAGKIVSIKSTLYVDFPNAYHSKSKVDFLSRFSKTKCLLLAKKKLFFASDNEDFLSQVPIGCDLEVWFWFTGTHIVQQSQVAFFEDAHF